MVGDNANGYVAQESMPDRSNRVEVGTSGFCTAVEAASEYAYKRRCMEVGKVMYHAHIGLSTWPATLAALQQVAAELVGRGHGLDRYGLCLDRAMSVPEDLRHLVPRETGPLLTSEEWPEVGRESPAQPHLGDFMIGTSASLDNTTNALRAGITTVGNLGQFFTFDIPGGGDDLEVTEATVGALRLMAATRTQGAVVHSYLDDGPAMQFANYGNYLGWAALEVHIVEEMLGARLAHCFGGLVPQPRARALLALALRRLHADDAAGSMIYGNTVDYTKDRVHNQAVLSNYLMVDIATQLRQPTGHAVNPVPLSENIRIPDATDILDVHLLAREIEREARRSGDLFDWAGLEAQAAETAAYARQYANRILRIMADDGVDTRDPSTLLLALRQIDIRRLQDRVNMRPSDDVASLEPWKAGTSRALASDVIRAGPQVLDRARVVLASLDVHDLMRDVLLRALRSLGAEVIVLPADSRPDAVIQAAVEEDADVVVISTYNGGALSQARHIATAMRDLEFDGRILMGGVLNEEIGQSLPIDVHDQIRALGIRCVDDVTMVPALVAEAV